MWLDVGASIALSLVSRFALGFVFGYDLGILILQLENVWL